MTKPEYDPGHGDSVAAWVTVSIMLLAITAGAVFFYLDMAVAVYACVAVLVIAPVIGWVLSKAGLGAKSHAKQH